MKQPVTFIFSLKYFKSISYPKIEKKQNGPEPKRMFPTLTLNHGTMSFRRCVCGVHIEAGVWIQIGVKWILKLLESSQLLTF